MYSQSILDIVNNKSQRVLVTLYRLSWRWWWEQDGRGGEGGGLGDADVEPPSRGAREDQQDLEEVRPQWQLLLLPLVQERDAA